MLNMNLWGRSLKITMTRTKMILALVCSAARLHHLWPLRVVQGVNKVFPRYWFLPALLLMHKANCMRNGVAVDLCLWKKVCCLGGIGSGDMENLLLEVLGRSNVYSKNISYSGGIYTCSVKPKISPM